MRLGTGIVEFLQRPVRVWALVSHSSFYSASFVLYPMFLLFLFTAYKFALACRLARSLSDLFAITVFASIDWFALCFFLRVWLWKYDLLSSRLLNTANHAIVKDKLLFKGMTSIFNFTSKLPNFVGFTSNLVGFWM